MAQTITGSQVYDMNAVTTYNPVDESERNGINQAVTTLMETEEILETNAYIAGVDGRLHFDRKVKLLVNHFSHCYNSGKLRWMRTSVDGSKGFYPVGQRKVGYNGFIDRIILLIWIEFHEKVTWL